MEMPLTVSLAEIVKTYIQTSFCFNKSFSCVTLKYKYGKFRVFVSGVNLPLRTNVMGII